MNKLLTTSIIGVLIATTSVAYAQEHPEGNPPSFIKYEVTDSVIRVHFHWLGDLDPGFIKGRAAEFGLHIAASDAYLMPRSGEDINPKVGFDVPESFPCPYRDVYNYSRATVESVKAGLRDYCKDFPTTLRLLPGLVDNLAWAINLARDQSWQFSVGPNCPENFKKGVPYRFEYQVRKNEAHEKSSDYGFAWFNQDGVKNYFNCPLVSGDIGAFLRDFLEEHINVDFLGDQNAPRKLINRLCVPTDPYPYYPPQEYGAPDLQAHGTECRDKYLDENTGTWKGDGDGYFEIQSYLMHGTRVGDCNNDDANIDNSFYSRAANACECGDIGLPCCPNNECWGSPPPICDPSTYTCVPLEKDPPPIGPCSGRVNGYYCGGTLPGYSGSPNDLVLCQNDLISGNPTLCATGCHISPPGVNDYCEPVCGNSIKEADESCDGTDLSGETCQSLNYDAGDLTCTDSCAFEVGDCCYNDCDSFGATQCSGGIQQSCADYDDDQCLEWGNDIICSNGCNGNACTGGVSCLATIYAQNYDGGALFTPGNGSQVFSDTTEFVTQGGTQDGLSYVGGQAGDAMAIHKGSVASASTNVVYKLKQGAAANQILRFSFWIYNNQSNPVTIYLRRGPNSPISHAIPPGAWHFVSSDLDSWIGTTALDIEFGSIPWLSSNWSIAIDSLAVEVCE